MSRRIADRGGQGNATVRAESEEGVVTENRDLDRRAIAERIVAVSGMGATRLAKTLRTTVLTLDRLVTSPEEVQEAVYRRVVPRLEALEQKVAEYKAANAPRPEGAGTAALFSLLTKP